MSDYLATHFSQAVKLGEEEQEERFDYTDSSLQEQGDSMLSVAGSPRRTVKPWSFMDTFNPKKQALAIAREIDVKRGIRLELPLKQEKPASEPVTDENTSQSTIRRVPSGAKPQPNGQNLRATTPVENDAATSGNTNEQSIGDVAGQSTPLTLARIVHQEESQGEKVKQPEEDKELKAMSKILMDKDKQLEILSQEIITKEHNIIAITSQFNEVKGLLELSKKDRLLDGEANAGMIKDLREEINRKSHSIKEMLTKSEEIEEKSEQQREKLRATIEDLKEQLARERENGFTELRAADTDWQNKIEEKEVKLRASYDADKSQYEHKISMLQEEFNNKLREINALEKTIKDLSKELDDQFQALEKAKRTNDELESQCNVTKKKLQDMEEQNQQLKRDLQSSKSSRNELQTENTGIMTKLQVANDHIRELEKSLELAKSSQTTLRNDYELTMKQVEEASKLNEQRKSELGALKESNERTRVENNDLKEKLNEASKTNDELKKDVLKVQMEKEKAAHNSEKLQTAIQQEQLDHEKTTKNLRKSEEYSSNLTKFVENMTLFNVHIGTVMLHSFGKNHQVTCIDPFFTIQNKDIIGFHTKSHDQKHQELDRRIDSLTLKNQKLVSQIDNQWKVKVEALTQESITKKKVLDQLEIKVKEAEKKSKELESRQLQSQEEKATMLKEKNDLIREQAALNNTINVLKGSHFNKEQDKILSLVEKMDKVTTTITQIREQIRQEAEENAKLKSSIESKEKELNDIRKECNDQILKLEEYDNIKVLLESKETELAQLQPLYAQQKAELDQLTIDLKRLEGDQSRRITYEVARQSRPDIDRALYDKLMISKVDSIDRVELQNIVKNLILLLEIPFNKLTKKGPLVAIYLKYERPIFSYFANRLHFELFNEAIDMRRFTNEAYDQYTDTHNMNTIKHPLESCLENLYQKLVSRF